MKKIYPIDGKFIPINEIHNMKYIYAHIPRTGGKSLWQYLLKYNKNEEVIYHHTKKNIETYKYNLYNSNKIPIFTILRNPINRVISEWQSYGKKRDIFDYINDKSTHNTQVKFLLGYKMNDSINIHINDIQFLKKKILEKKLIINIFETFDRNNLFELLNIPKTNIENTHLDKNIKKKKIRMKLLIKLKK